MNHFHSGVLLNETILSLNIISGEKYIDCTIGGGDYTEAILKKGGIVLGIDQDPVAIAHCANRFYDYINSHQLVINLSNFENIKTTAAKENFNNVSGIVYDFGISSNQLDDSERGFSFKYKDAKLDMRMSLANNVKASDLLTVLDGCNLAKMFYRVGDFPQASKLVKTIVEYRRSNPIVTVADFIKILSKVQTDIYRNDFATKAFLALRIAVNNEIDSISKSLQAAIELLKPAGRLAMVSFQSLEDKLAKNLRNSYELTAVTKKPILPSNEEVISNPRSKSAKLRIYEKRK